MSDFKLIAMRNVDVTMVQVVVYEDRQEAGTLILTPGGWQDLKEKLLRTKVKCEG